ncbi:MAG TPA: M1 family metallopeptidase [Trueperaceae bacterium]
MTKRLLVVLAAFVVAYASMAQAVLDASWDDLTPFRAGLVDAGVLSEFEDAPMYHLRLQLSDDLARVTGTEEVRATNRSDSSWREIVFRLYPNTLGSRLEVSAARVNAVAVEPVLENQDTVLRLPLPRALAPGDSLVATLHFELRVAREPALGYGRLGIYPDVLSLAHGYPILAVYQHGAWDRAVPPNLADPTFAVSSLYLVEVSAPAGQTLVASGQERSRVLDGDRQTVVFAAGPVREFYLASARGYTRQSLTLGETTIRSFAPAALSAGAGRALHYAEDALRVYSRRFVRYPYRELDVVAVPVRAGGIEYPGIINVANSLYDQQRGFFEGVVAHEVAHQWFYGLIGNDQVAEPWLDESFAQYATLLYYLDVRGAAAARSFRASLRADWADARNHDMAIGLPATAYTEHSYSPIVYGRGPLFLAELAQDLGQDRLNEILRDYAEHYEFGVADTEDFRRLAETDCACDLGSLFRTWVYPMNAP